jgi:hypothetical protein
MAKRSMMGVMLIGMAPNGGGTFSRPMLQTNPTRLGALCIFAPPAEAGCGGDCGCECGCDDAPVPDTAMSDGTGGVFDIDLSLEWAGRETHV